MYQSLKIVQSAILRLPVGKNVLRIAEVLLLTNKTETWKRKELLSCYYLFNCAESNHFRNINLHEDSKAIPPANSHMLCSLSRLCWIYFAISLVLLDSAMDS